MLDATRIHAAVRRSDYSARWYRMYVCAYGLRCDYPRLRLNLLRGCRAFAIAKKSHDYPITASEGPFQDGRTEADYKPKPRAPGWAEVAAPKTPPEQRMYRLLRRTQLKRSNGADDPSQHDMTRQSQFRTSGRSLEEKLKPLERKGSTRNAPNSPLRS